MASRDAPVPHPPAVSRRAALGGAAALGLAALGACSAASSSPPAPTGASSTAAGAVSVLDQRGRRLTLAQPARRIVTVPMPAASLVVAVDQGPSHLVGMHKASWTAMRDGVLGEFFPEVLKVEHDIATTDFVPNVEGVLALHPDLVAQWGDQGAGLLAPLENAGLTVAGLRYGRQEDLDAWVGLFATVLGREERGQRISSAIAASLAAVRAETPTRTGPPAKVLYFNRFADGLKVAGTGTYNDGYIGLVGARTPPPDPVARHRRDGGRRPGAARGVGPRHHPARELRRLRFPATSTPPRVGGLTAVREGRVYKVPPGGYRWDPPSHESPLMWRWLAMLVHPTGPRFDLFGEIQLYYRLYYGRTPTPTQLKAMLWADANSHSAHYQQFDVS